MTDPLEAARAYVAAGDALKSPEHAADVEKLRELSNRVREREAALEAAQEALFGAHQEQVQTGEAEPAPNVEAAKTIGGKPWVEQFLNGDHPALSADEGEQEKPAWPEYTGNQTRYFQEVADQVLFNDTPEEATARANGAYSED